MTNQKISPKSLFVILFSILSFLILYLSANIVSNINNSDLAGNSKADAVDSTCHKERLMWMWNTRRKDEWQGVKLSGANVVSVEGNESRSSSAVMNSDLNYLTSINMKGIIQLDTIFDAQKIFDTVYQAKVRDYISAIKNNAGIYGYFLADEPDIGRRVTADKIRKLNEIVKSVDSLHPTILNLYTIYSGEIKEYIGTADIEGVDYYAWSGDPKGTWRSNPAEFASFTNRFIDYYNDLTVNNTKENFVFIQAYKWTPGNIQPATNINYIPTFDDLNNLLTGMKNKSDKYKAHAYYYWSSESIPETTLDTVPELLNTVSRISDTWRYDYGAYPVEVGCGSTYVNPSSNTIQIDPITRNPLDPTINRASLLPNCSRTCENDTQCGSGYKCLELSSSACNPVNGTKQSCVYVGDPLCNPTNISNQCRVQFYTNTKGLGCFKILSLEDCNKFNNYSIEPRYIMFGGNKNTNPDTTDTTCQNNENIISSGTLVEAKEYCANVAGTNYKYNQVDFNFKIKYSVDIEGKITNDKCSSGGIEPGGVCSTKSLQCSKYDLNKDGVINILGDFLEFKASFGKIGNSLAADFNSDMKVDIVDYIVFRTAFYKYIEQNTCEL